LTCVAEGAQRIASIENEIERDRQKTRAEAQFFQRQKVDYFPLRDT
jgi:hypothetical protein